MINWDNFASWLKGSDLGQQYEAEFAEEVQTRRSQLVTEIRAITKKAEKERPPLADAARAAEEKLKAARDSLEAADQEWARTKMESFSLNVAVARDIAERVLLRPQGLSG